MRKFNLTILFSVAFMLILGATAFAQNKVSKKEAKRLEGVGYLSVTTKPDAYPIFINGKDYGLSSSPEPSANPIELPIGSYDVEIRFPKETKLRKITIDSQKRVCVCYSMTKKQTTRPCPYTVAVDAPTAVLDGDLISFTADPTYTGPPVNLNYKWTISPDTVQIREGQGTPTISVDSTSLGSQRIVATLEVDTGYDDNSCRQRINATVDINPQKERDKTTFFDGFDFTNNDKLKARLDNFSIALQAQPDMQGYLIVYARRGTKPQEADRLGIRALNYLTREKGFDARKIVVVNGGFRQRAGFEIYLVPPGADPPMPRPQ